MAKILGGGNMFIVKIIVLFFMVMLSSSSFADWRPYAYSYSYMTAYQGEREIEVYTDYDNKSGSYSLKNQIELEYGVNSNWMASIYGVFTGGSGKEYKYSQTKLQTRYRFGKPNQYMIDPAIYLEYKISTDGSTALEYKEILSKDFGDYNFTTNLVFEKNLSKSTEWEKGYTLGFSKLFSTNIRAGIEAKGTIADQNATLFAGPSLSMSFGGLKIVSAVGFGLNSASKNLYARNIIAYEF